MVKMWNIAVKNLKTAFRDKKSLIMTILMPIVFYTLMGSIFNGIDNNTEPYIYKVGWIDTDSSNSNDPYKNLTYIYGVIDDLDNFDVSIYNDNETATSDLEGGAIDAYIIIPEGFELYINGSGPEPTEDLKIYFKGSKDAVTKNIISGTIKSVMDNIVNFNPLAKEIDITHETITGGIINQLTSATPGFLMYGILSALIGGIILITTEKKEGLLKRLESSQLKANDMIGGHQVYNTTIILLQFTIGIIVLSILGFRPLYSDIFSLIFGLFLTVVILSIFQNALAILLSTIFKTPEVSGGAVWLVMVPLMAFSGALFPLETIMPNLIPYVKWIPTRLVVVIFQDLMLNSISLLSPQIWMYFGVILLESLVLLLIALKRYRKFAQS